MKNSKSVLPMFLVVFLILTSGCTTRLVDFTVISTKNAEIGVDKTKGKRTEGEKTYFLGFGFNLKDALDNALENAGTKYDLLVDGVVTYTNLPFVVKVNVKGIAVSSSDLLGELGEEGYKEWCKANNIQYSSKTKTVKP